ncbi:MAG: hypothetical protein LAO76_14765 [Acidobacteriia bacterium]|nr:hypothetical protein [Terriglobia bacterium]
MPDHSEQSAQAVNLLTEAEAEDVIDRFVERFFSSESTTLRWLLNKGWSHPEYMSLVARSWGMPEIPEQARIDLLRCIETNDKVSLKSWLVKLESRDGMTREQAKALFSLFDLSPLRKILLDLAETFKGTQGRQPKLKLADYPRLIQVADSLSPLIGKILSQLEQSTKKTALETVMFWQADHPEAAGFLLSYYKQFELALHDATLKRRSKRPATRAKLLAEAMAGMEYGLTFSTSIERVRQARRMQQS